MGANGIFNKNHGAKYTDDEILRANWPMEEIFQANGQKNVRPIAKRKLHADIPRSPKYETAQIQRGQQKAPLPSEINNADSMVEDVKKFLISNF